MSFLIIFHVRKQHNICSFYRVIRLWSLFIFSYCGRCIEFRTSTKHLWILFATEKYVLIEHAHVYFVLYIYTKSVRSFERAAHLRWLENKIAKSSEIWRKILFLHEFRKKFVANFSSTFIRLISIVIFSSISKSS